MHPPQSEQPTFPQQPDGQSGDRPPEQPPSPPVVVRLASLSLWTASFALTGYWLVWMASVPALAGEDPPGWFFLLVAAATVVLLSLALLYVQLARLIHRGRPAARVWVSISNLVALWFGCSGWLFIRNALWFRGRPVDELSEALPSWLPVATDVAAMVGLVSLLVGVVLVLTPAAARFSLGAPRPVVRPVTAPADPHLPAGLRPHRGALITAKCGGAVGIVGGALAFLAVALPWHTTPSGGSSNLAELSRTDPTAQLLTVGAAGQFAAGMTVMIIAGLLGLVCGLLAVTLAGRTPLVLCGVSGMVSAVLMAVAIAVIGGAFARLQASSGGGASGTAVALLAGLLLFVGGVLALSGGVAIGARSTRSS